MLLVLFHEGSVVFDFEIDRIIDLYAVAYYFNVTALTNKIARMLRTMFYRDTVLKIYHFAQVYGLQLLEYRAIHYLKQNPHYLRNYQLLNGSELLTTESQHVLMDVIKKVNEEERDRVKRKQLKLQQELWAIAGPSTTGRAVEHFVKAEYESADMP